MAIAGTMNLTVRPIYPMPRIESQDLVPMGIFDLSGEDTGDGSGGSVVFSGDITDLDKYYRIDDIFCWTNDANAMLLAAVLDTNDWANLSKITTSNSYQFWNSATQAFGFSSYQQRDRLIKPIYIGKPVAGSTPTINFVFQTNTDTKLYGCQIKGSFFGKENRYL